MTCIDVIIVPTESVADRRGGGTHRDYLNYWETVYVTTQSDALRQKASDILRGNGIPLPERK